LDKGKGPVQAGPFHILNCFKLAHNTLPEQPAPARYYPIVLAPVLLDGVGFVAGSAVFAGTGGSTGFDGEEVFMDPGVVAGGLVSTGFGVVGVLLDPGLVAGGFVSIGLGVLEGFGLSVGFGVL
jgi:hypothetical protein